MSTPWSWKRIICNLGILVPLSPKTKSLCCTGLAISTAILDMRMNDLLKNLTAFSAFSEVLNPTYPIRRFGMNFTSVMGANFSKCSLKSSSVNLAWGRFLMKIREDLTL